jgi:hypothetical protein
MWEGAPIPGGDTEFLTKLSKGQSSGIEVEVTDLETNTTTTYHAIRAAARALDIDKRYIEHYIYLKQNKPVLGRYTFKLNLNSDDKSTNLIHEKVQKTSMKVEVTNVDTKEVTIYSSISAAASNNPNLVIKSPALGTRAGLRRSFAREKYKSLQQLYRK